MTKTITFSEYSLYTVNPTFKFSDNVVTTRGVIVEDGAQPNSPVIAANSSYEGPVFIYFDVPVTDASLAAGYFDNIGSTRIEFRNAAGELLKSYHNSSYGVVTFSCQSDEGIASIAVINESSDESGFSVDTIKFDGEVSELDPPDVAIVKTAGSVDKIYGQIDGDSELVFHNSVGTADERDFIKLTVSDDTTARISIYLDDNKDNVKEVTVDLTAGVNILSFSALDGYDSLENYTAVIKVTDYVDPDKEFLDDLIAGIAEGVLSYDKVQEQIASYLKEAFSNKASALKFLGKYSDKLSNFGFGINIANRIDSIQAAGNWKRQAVIEVTDMFVEFALTKGVKYASFIAGTALSGPFGAIAAEVGDKAISVIYSSFISDYVRDLTGDAYDSLTQDALLQALSLDSINDFALQAAADTDVDFSSLVFDEKWYLETYKDAADAVASGQAVSGIAYYLKYGAAKGHAINEQGTVVAESERTGGLSILDAGDVVTSNLNTLELGERAGDLVSQSEAALTDYINDEIRTEGTELNVNAALSALANRIAADWMFNHDGSIELEIIDGGENWAETLSNGESYQEFLEELATEAGIDLSETTLLASWTTAETPKDIYAQFATLIDGAGTLAGIDFNSVGIAQIGGLWILLVSTENLADDASQLDDATLHISGDDYANDISGTHQDDYIDGNGGNDHLEGLRGNDTILGADGNDWISGEKGNDQILGGAGNDTIYGGAGLDSLSGGSGNDTLSGGDGKDRIFGGQGADSLNGGWGDDYLDGGAGADDMTGAAGNDVYIVDNAGDKLHEKANEGTDLVKSSVTFSLKAHSQHIENLTLTGNRAINGTGNALGNQIIGNMQNNSLNGLDGNDNLTGNAGADKLFGGNGHDILAGGSGNDLLYGGNGDDQAFGNLGNDRLFGGQGNDLLDGGAGVDIMTGNVGNDVYIVDNGNDKAVELAGQGTDLVKSSVTFSLQTNGQQVENLTLTGNAAINGTGNGLGNVVNGNMSGNILNGLAGNDKLFGKGGADTINGGNGNDALHGGNGNDLLRGANGNDILNGNAGADNLNGGLGNDQLNGGVGNDVLNGMAGSDRLVGAAGADRMYGAAGADSFIGGLGADSMYAGNDNAVDSFIFNSVNDSKAGLAHDKIYLFDSGEDVLDLSHIDANTSVAGNQTFAFAGTQAAAHSVWLEADGSDLLVFADNNGDAVADFELQLMDKASVVAGDFLL
nr:calcium-binding protein [uncultured Cohaesibacter sp.]